MQQQELLIGPWDSFLEALRDDVKALGGSKAVGAWFIPEKSVEAQRNYVNDRLSAERREKFDDEQVELIMRRAVKERGYSAAHFHRCDVLGTEAPESKEPGDGARSRDAIVRRSGRDGPARRRRSQAPRR